MKKHYLNLGMVVLAAGIFSFTSCKKDSLSMDATVVEAAQDDATADNLYDDVYSEMDESVTDLEDNDYSTSSASLKSAEVEGSKTITVNKSDTVNYPKTITIVYNNWTDNAGRIKNGTIVINVTGPYRKIGSTKTITLQNFTIDSIAIEGTHTVTNLGRNSSENLQYSVVLENGKVTLTDGRYMTREFTRTRTWVAGEITPRFIWDDAYMIEGAASGVNFNGINYSRTIINPLYLAADCPWVAKGSVQIIAGDKSMVIDYGDAAAICDNKATVTKDGLSRVITLHRGQKRR